MRDLRPIGLQKPLDRNRRIVRRCFGWVRRHRLSINASCSPVCAPPYAKL
jgi:hypothetical protein